MKHLKQSLKVSGIAGLVSASCCTIPLLLIILGLSATAAGTLNAQIASLRWTLLIPLGLIIASVGIYKKVKETDNICSLRTLVTMLCTYFFQKILNTPRHQQLQ
ncbi:MAG: hypothetical protein O2779_03885 [Nanoarchaeota archaeon]|nr:hypothetical protein [Nanoarchaeota archaeon]